MLEWLDAESALDEESECETDHAEQQDETVFSPRVHQAGFWN